VAETWVAGRLVYRAVAEQGEPAKRPP